MNQQDSEIESAMQSQKNDSLKKQIPSGSNQNPQLNSQGPLRAQDANSDQNRQNQYNFQQNGGHFEGEGHVTVEYPQEDQLENLNAISDFVEPNINSEQKNQKTNSQMQVDGQEESVQNTTQFQKNSENGGQQMVEQNVENTQSEPLETGQVVEHQGFQVLKDCNQQYLSPDKEDLNEEESASDGMDDGPSFHQEIARDKDQVANSHILSGQEAETGQQNQNLQDDSQQNLNPAGFEDKQSSEVDVSYEEDDDEESSNQDQPRSVGFNHEENSGSKNSYHTGLDQPINSSTQVQFVKNKQDNEEVSEKQESSSKEVEEQSKEEGQESSQKQSDDQSSSSHDHVQSQQDFKDKIEMAVPSRSGKNTQPKPQSNRGGRGNRGRASLRSQNLGDRESGQVTTSPNKGTVQSRSTRGGRGRGRGTALAAKASIQESQEDAKSGRQTRNKSRQSQLSQKLASQREPSPKKKSQDQSQEQAQFIQEEMGESDIEDMEMKNETEQSEKKNSETFELIKSEEARECDKSSEDDNEDAEEQIVVDQEQNSSQQSKEATVKEEADSEEVDPQYQKVASASSQEEQASNAEEQDQSSDDSQEEESNKGEETVEEPSKEESGEQGEVSKQEESNQSEENEQQSQNNDSVDSSEHQQEDQIEEVQVESEEEEDEEKQSDEEMVNEENDDEEETQNQKHSPKRFTQIEDCEEEESSEKESDSKEEPSNKQSEQADQKNVEESLSDGQEMIVPHALQQEENDEQDMEDESGEESYKEEEGDDKSSDHELPECFESELLCVEDQNGADDIQDEVIQNEEIEDQSSNELGDNEFSEPTKQQKNSQEKMIVSAQKVSYKGTPIHSQIHASPEKDISPIKKSSKSTAKVSVKKQSVKKQQSLEKEKSKKASLKKQDVQPFEELIVSTIISAKIDAVKKETVKKEKSPEKTKPVKQSKIEKRQTRSNLDRKGNQVIEFKEKKVKTVKKYLAVKKEKSVEKPVIERRERSQRSRAPLETQVKKTKTEKVVQVKMEKIQVKLEKPQKKVVVLEKRQTRGSGVKEVIEVQQVKELKVQKVKEPKKEEVVLQKKDSEKASKVSVRSQKIEPNAVVPRPKSTRNSSIPVPVPDKKETVLDKKESVTDKKESKSKTQKIEPVVRERTQRTTRRSETEVVQPVEVPKLKQHSQTHKKQVVSKVQEKLISNSLGFSVPSKDEQRETRKTRASTSREITKQPSKSKVEVVQELKKAVRKTRESAREPQQTLNLIVSKPQTRNSKVEEEVVKKSTELKVQKVSRETSGNKVVNLNIQFKQASTSSAKAKSNKAEKAEKVQKEVKNTTILGFDSKNQLYEDNQIAPEINKFSNPFGGNSLGLIGPSKVQAGRIGKSIKEEKQVLVNNSKSFNSKNQFTGKFLKKRDEKAVEKLSKKDDWKEDEVEIKNRKYQKKNLVVALSPKKPVDLPKEAEIERSIVKKTPIGNPFPSYLPQHKKYATLFGSGPNFNPFLKKRLSKTLVATPSKFEIRHDAAIKKIEKAAPKAKKDKVVKKDLVQKPQLRGIRDKLKSVKNQSVKKTKQPKKLKVAKESKKINKEQLKQKMKKKLFREKKVEAQKQIKANRDKRRKERQAKQFKVQQKRDQLRVQKAAKKEKFLKQIEKKRQLKKEARLKKLQEALRKKEEKAQKKKSKTLVLSKKNVKSEKVSKKQVKDKKSKKLTGQKRNHQKISKNTRPDKKGGKVVSRKVKGGVSKGKLNKKK